MKLLFDENLSPRLTSLLADVYPDSLHVREVGLRSAADTDIWNYAARHHLTIISKDDDFHQRSFLSGPPPKVVWIRLGNCSTAQIAALLRLRRRDLEDFAANPLAAFLALARSAE
ncbi:MAG: DUF5615 family PIN-like protein [Elusimicrobia bacterium]|nr:DUF5615 family PIN-like protein [Elusimicrobiota bacterium]